MEFGSLTLNISNFDDFENGLDSVGFFFSSSTHLFGDYLSQS